MQDTTKLIEENDRKQQLLDEANLIIEQRDTTILQLKPLEEQLAQLRAELEQKTDVSGLYKLIATQSANHTILLTGSRKLSTN